MPFGGLRFAQNDGGNAFDFVVLSGAKDPYAPPTFPADLRAGSTAFRVVVLSGAKRSRRTRTPVIATGNDAACGRQEGRISHYVRNDEGRTKKRILRLRQRVSRLGPGGALRIVPESYARRHKPCLLAACASLRMTGWGLNCCKRAKKSPRKQGEKLVDYVENNVYNIGWERQNWIFCLNILDRF